MHSPQKGTNAPAMRRYNERLILSAIRRSAGASKAELARSTTLSPQAVTRIVDELEADGLLLAAEKRTGGMGQPATVYRINGKRGHTVGVEVGRSGVILVLLDFDGERRAVQREPGAFPSIATVLAHIARFIGDLTADGRLPAPDMLMGIGIAMPWFLGEWREEIGISSDQAEEWRREDVADRLREGLTWPVFFENDGNAAALAQLLCGRGRDLQNFLNIHIGTFVGGGVVLGGQLLQGRHGNAGAIASFPVCTRAGSDYLVHHASLYSLAADATTAEMDDWCERCAEALAFATIGANSLLDLEAVILDGSLTDERLATVMAAVVKHLEEDAPPDFFVPMLRQGSLGDLAASIGAGLLPLHASFSPDLASLFKKV